MSNEITGINSSGQNQYVIDNYNIKNNPASGENSRNSSAQDVIGQFKFDKAQKDKNIFEYKQIQQKESGKNQVASGGNKSQTAATRSSS